jgi:hypothetical protein
MQERDTFTKSAISMKMETEYSYYIYFAEIEPTHINRY